jgi:hypothetical protein
MLDLSHLIAFANRDGVHINSNIPLGTVFYLSFPSEAEQLAVRLAEAGMIQCF